MLPAVPAGPVPQNPELSDGTYRRWYSPKTQAGQEAQNEKSQDSYRLNGDGRHPTDHCGLRGVGRYCKSRPKPNIDTYRNSHNSR